jgi:hypothetical protein
MFDDSLVSRPVSFACVAVRRLYRIAERSGIVFSYLELLILREKWQVMTPIDTEVDGVQLNAWLLYVRKFFFGRKIRLEKT